MKKLKLKLGGFEPLAKEQMKKIAGGYQTRCYVNCWGSYYLDSYLGTVSLWDEEQCPAYSMLTLCWEHDYNANAVTCECSW